VLQKAKQMREDAYCGNELLRLPHPHSPKCLDAEDRDNWKKGLMLGYQWQNKDRLWSFKFLLYRLKENAIK